MGNLEQGFFTGFNHWCASWAGNTYVHEKIKLRWIFGWTHFVGMETWWKTNSTKLPTLVKLASAVLSVPATIIVPV